MTDSHYILTSEKREHYLYVHVKADSTDRSKLLNWLAEVVLLSADTHLRRILVDRDIPNVIMDFHVGAALTAVADIDLGVRLAIVNRFAEVGREMKAALAALGKLQPNIGFFDDLADAEDWLAKDIVLPKAT